MDAGSNLTNIAVRESQCVPGALGVFAIAPVPEIGAMVAQELPLALSLDSAKIDLINYNERFAWSITEEILKTTSPETRAGLLEAKYARGLVTSGRHWEDMDTRILERLATVYREKVTLIHTLYDIVATNALTAELASEMVPIAPGDPRMYCIVTARRHGFYKTFSRINHSCGPNATMVAPRGRLGPLVLRSLRPIEANEEITINYLNERGPTSRTQLFEAFNFVCTCPLCLNLCSRLECRNRGDKACPCGTVRYCSRDCQVAHWKTTHRAQCKR